MKPFDHLLLRTQPGRFERDAFDGMPLDAEDYQDQHSQHHV